MAETFISVADLAAFTHQEIAADDPNAVIALNAACQEVLDYLGDVLYHQADEVLLDGSGVDSLVLPARPVWSVSGVWIDEVVLAEGSWAVGELVGVLYRLDWAVWPFGRRRIRVIYTHGYRITEEEESGGGSGSGSGGAGSGIEPLPDSIRKVALELAAANLAFGATGGGGIVAENIGDYGYRKSESGGGLSLTVAQKGTIAPYRVMGGHPVYRP